MKSKRQRKWIFVSLAISFFLLIPSLSFAQANNLPTETNIGISESPLVENDETTSFIGFEAGINYNLFSQDMRWDKSIPNSIYEVWKKGNGFSPCFSFLYIYDSKKLLGVIFKASLDYKQFSSEGTGLRDCQREFALIDETLKVDLTTSAVYFGVTTLVKINIFKDFYLAIGPYLLFPLVNTTEEYTIDNLTKACPLADSSNTLKIENDYLETNTLLGIEAGAAYIIKLSNRLKLVHQLQFQYNLNDFGFRNFGSSCDNTRQYSYGISCIRIDSSSLLSFRFSLALLFGI